MHSSRLMLLALLVLSVFCLAPQARAEALEVIVLGQEDENDPRMRLPIKVIEMALERTKGDFGLYEIVYKSGDGLRKQRKLSMLDKGQISILLSATQPMLEERFLPVRVPFFGGLLGYRVALIMGHSQPKYTNISTLDDLKAFTIGQGSGWEDVEILQAAGLEVYDKAGYRDLFKMLEKGRFDFYMRGVHEAYPEAESWGKDIPGIAVEEGFCVLYRFPAFFFVSPTQPELAKHLEQGLREMLVDGTLHAELKAAYGSYFAKADLGNRVIIELDNPLLTPETAALLDDPSLWVDPRQGM